MRGLTICLTIRLTLTVQARVHYQSYNAQAKIGLRNRRDLLDELLDDFIVGSMGDEGVDDLLDDLIDGDRASACTLSIVQRPSQNWFAE